MGGVKIGRTGRQAVVCGVNISTRMTDCIRTNGPDQEALEVGRHVLLQLLHVRHRRHDVWMCGGGGEGGCVGSSETGTVAWSDGRHVVNAMTTHPRG